jgi:hypothetical protein
MGVLAGAIFVFAFMTTLLLIVDAATGMKRITDEI